MRPVFQRQGNDCMRAAVASVLERDYDDVWHFMERRDADGRWWGWHVDEWLKSEGYPFRLGHFGFRSAQPLDRLHTVSFWLEKPWWIGLVASSSNHAVVMKGNQLMHDPLQPPLSEYRLLEAMYFYIPDPVALIEEIVEGEAAAAERAIRYPQESSR